MLKLRFIFPVILFAATLFVALPAGPALAITYQVNVTTDGNDLNTADGICDSDPAAGNQCSLRAAIQQANVTGANDIINFSSTVFPVATPVTIPLGSALPTMTGGADTVDGTSAGVIVQGVEARTFSCVVIDSTGNTIKGLQLTDCGNAIALNSSLADNNTVGPANTITDSGIGVFVFGDGNTVIGNKIGTNATGSAVPPEGGNNEGTRVSGGNNVVGSTSSASRNIISGNATGVIFLGAAASGNAVRGNYIGTDSSGMADLGNTIIGVQIQTSATGNTIGGILPGEGNLISGNQNGLSILTASNTVSGNIIGPDINGSGAVMTNSNVGVQVGGTSNTIGPGNVISDWSASGIQIDSEFTVVKGNLIGTNLAGAAAVPNAGHGVFISSGQRFNVVGGLGPGEGNVIAFNGIDGIEVFGNGTTGNSIRANSIHSNTALEIDNAFGGNTEIPPPSLNMLSPTANSVSGTACPNCAVDIFSTGTGGTDSRIYEGSVTANSGGAFTFTSAGPLAGTNLVATHTDGFGNTSELSAAVFAEICDGLDNDNDGLKDEGHPDSDGDGRKDCVDAGFTAFYPPGHSHSAPVADCSGVAEDFDGFKDTDGCPEPDNDNDGYPDSGDTCPGNDNLMGSDGALGVGGDNNHNGLVDGGETWAPLGTSGNDDSVRTYEDYDGILDTDGCHDSPCDDVDGDSFGATIGPCALFADEREAALGTNSLRACAATPTPNDEPMDPWPLDTNDDGFIDVISDIVSVSGRFGEAQTPANVRYDLNLSGFIDIFDIILVANRFGETCTPPGPMG